MTKTYKKLIRDRIPEIIEQSGNSCSIHELDDEEFLVALQKKLQEEVQEYLEEPSVEELADIMEVVYALSLIHGADSEALERVRISKVDKRGGFSKKLFLETVDIDD